MNVAIVLNYRSPQETIRCSMSILEYCGSIDKLIVVDNASGDASAQILSEWSSLPQNVSKVVFLESPVNSGYAGGNNFGLRWARENLSPKYFWIVNSDAYVDSDAFRPMLDSLGERNAIVGSVIVSDASNRLECFGGGDVYPLLGKARLFMKGAEYAEVKNGVRRVPDYLMGCSLAFPNFLIDQLGYMDEAYFMYSEEVDWQYKAKRNGWVLVVRPDSRVFHQGSVSAGGKSEFYYYYRNRAAVRFNKRFYGGGVAVFSFFSLAFFMLYAEFKSPKKVLSGVKGAFAGVFMDV